MVAQTSEWRGSAMIRQAVLTDDAPHAIGPYSQGIVANGFIFCSGTAGIDPATGVAPDGIDEQTELALRNLDAILTAAGASLATLSRPPSSMRTSTTLQLSTQSMNATCRTRRRLARPRPT
jgi:enamine deaminase RidA (YjgF/YER057c/UK114 family)